MKNNIKWIAVFAVLCIVCLAVLFYMKQTTAEHKTAEIIQNGRLIKVIDLSDIEKSYEFTVENEMGGFNRIRVEDGKIAVIDASCPDKICVKQGFIFNGTIPVVCLPNKLTISVSGESGEYDAAAGSQ